MKTLKLMFVGFIALGIIFSAGAQAEIRMVPDPYTTIQDAIDAASPGDIIMVGPGDYTGFEVTKAVEVIGCGDANITTPVDVLYCPLIDYQNVGITLKAYIILPPFSDASGSKISNINIVGDAPNPFVWGILSHNIDNVTISHVNISNVSRGINIAGCNGWELTHNTITGASVSGILLFGINLIKVSPSPTSNNNLIAFNNISSENNGIQLYASPWEPYGWIACQDPGEVDPIDIKGNKIVHNKITALYEGIILGGDPSPEADYYVDGNSIGFNDLRGSEFGILLYPDDLLDNNTLSRNFGGIWTTDNPDDPDYYTEISTGQNRAYDGESPVQFIPKLPEQ